jgi:hypothetical protein
MRTRIMNQLQALAMLDTETGEVEDRPLLHEGKRVWEFYSQLLRPRSR